MRTRDAGKAGLAAASLLALVIGATIGSDLDSAKAANQFFTMPLAKSFMPPSGFGPPNLPQSGESAVLVPQMPGLEVDLQPSPIAVPSRPAAWQHKFDAHLLIVGRTEKGDDRLRRPGEGTHEGGVTVLRPASPKT